MTLSTQPHSSDRDLYPEDARLQKYIFAKWREACERFGYEEYSAPVLESINLYLGTGNEAIVSGQAHAFAERDNLGGTVRTDWTPTVSRMIAPRYDQLVYPVRTYAMPLCRSYENTQQGQGGEFYQLNVDLFGVATTNADQEAILLGDSIIQSFGAARTMYTVKVNSYKLIHDVFTSYMGVGTSQAQALIRLIRGMRKTDPREFAQQVDDVLTPTQRQTGAASKLFAYLGGRSIERLPLELLHLPSLLELDALIVSLHESGVTNVEFDPTLMRSSDYYTGIVFEMIDARPDNGQAILGGGRYDSLVGTFGVEPVPAAGFAMSDFVLVNFLERHGLLPAFRSETDVYVVLVGDVADKAQRTIREMRNMGINVAVDLSGQAPDKQLESAAKKGVTYVLFVGERELAEEQFELRDLAAGTSERRSLARIVSIIKDYRRA